MARYFNCGTAEVAWENIPIDVNQREEVVEEKEEEEVKEGEEEGDEEKERR